MTTSSNNTLRYEAYTIGEETCSVMIYEEGSSERLHAYVAVPLKDVTALQKKLTAFLVTADSQNPSILIKLWWVATNVPEQYQAMCAEFLLAEYDMCRKLTPEEQAWGKDILEAFRTDGSTLNPNKEPQYVPKNTEIFRQLLTLIETAILAISTEAVGTTAIAVRDFLMANPKIISMESGKEGRNFQRVAGEYWIKLNGSIFDAKKIKALLEEMKRYLETNYFPQIPPDVLPSLDFE